MAQWLVHCLLLAVLTWKGVLSAESEERLVTRLFNSSRYNPMIRPAQFPTEIVTVKFYLIISQLISVNEKEEVMKTNVWLAQTWTDYRLMWNKEDYDHVQVIRVPSESVWKPDIVLFNNKDGQYDVALYTKVLIYDDGKVEWLPPAIYQSSCAIDVRHFPFDKQNCTMKFGSWTYNGDEVDIVLDSEEAVSDDFKLNGEWDIIKSPSRRTLEGDEVYVHYDFVIKRKPLFYIINLIIPCILISSLSVLVFYLPSDCGEKITLSISVLLALTVFLLLIADIIPSTSLDIPLIGRYLMFTMIFVTFTTVTTVYILNVHHRTASTHDMPTWIRIVFINVLPRILCIKRPADEEVVDVKETVIRTSLYHKPREDAMEMRKRNGMMTEGGRGFGTVPRSSSPGLGTQQTERRHLAPELEDAVKHVKYIAGFFKSQDDDSEVSDEWRFVAMVIDRICLWLFLLVCVVGTLGLFKEPLFDGDDV
ncbi:neuronal acetylcholine receptor subunit beta-4-like [Branchiostoma floridae x Branchiostoma japonicum]